MRAAQRGVLTRAKKDFELDLQGDKMTVTVDAPDGAEVYSVALAKPLGMDIEGVCTVCAL